MQLDVSQLRDHIKLYYGQVNPTILEQLNNVMEDTVTFTLSNGLQELENKLLVQYNVSILPYFKPELIRNLEPCTWEELSVLITAFASSPESEFNYQT